MSMRKKAIIVCKIAHKFGGGASGGYWALFRFELLAYYHQNLCIFFMFGFFRTFFCQKNCPTMVESHFKNTMENQLFEAPFFLDKTLQKIFQKCKYIGLCLRTAFGNNFGPWKVPKPENTCQLKCKFSSLGTSQGQSVFAQSPI